MRTGPYRELKEQVFRANLELFKRGLTKYSFGNVSGLDRCAEVIAIKPSGVPYAQLKPDKMVILDLAGNNVEGNLHSSSDIPTHLVLDRSFPNIGGVAHTHSTYAVSWAQARREIPCLGTTHADCSPRAIPCTLTFQ
jgi:L-ribulose-5-phosphate 4-epimerase